MHQLHNTWGQQRKTSDGGSTELDTVNMGLYVAPRFQVQYVDQRQQGLVRAKGSRLNPLQDSLACIGPAGFLRLPEAVDGNSDFKRLSEVSTLHLVSRLQFPVPGAGHPSNQCLCLWAQLSPTRAQ